MLANHRASRAFALSALVAGVAGIAFTPTARASGEGTAPKAANIEPNVVNPNLLISQIYGAGGEDGATWSNDYVVLFNAGTTSASLSGYSLQYADAQSSFSQGNTVNLSAKTIPAGGYYLVQLVGEGGGAGLPDADDTSSTVDLDDTSGKIALVNSTTVLTCTKSGTGQQNDCEPANVPAVIDLVGYGASRDYAGAGAAPSPTLTLATVRSNGGCTNTEVNSADFTAVTAVAPFNSSSPAHAACGTTPPVTDAGTDGGTTTSGGGLVISQVYGGYNYDDSTYDDNFVELFNSSGSSISLSGYTVQTASATGGFGVATDGGADAPDVIVLSGTVPAGGYYLIGMAAGTDAGAALPTPDSTAAAYLNYKNGKVALVHGTAALGCGGTGNLCAASTYVDLVGYGTTASQFEGSGAAPAIGDALSAQRNGSGCTDTNNNAADFTAAIPAARNSKTPVHVCSGTSSTTDAGTDSGTSGDASPGDDDDDDDNGDDDLGNPDASTGGVNEVSDANSGGCSTHGRSNGGNWGGAVGFGLFATAIVLFVRRRRNRR